QPAEQLLFEFARLADAGHELDAPGLAASAGMDLHLHNRLGLTKGLEGLGRFLRTRHRFTLRDRHAETAENMLGLEFVYVHPFPFTSRKPDVRASSAQPQGLRRDTEFKADGPQTHVRTA